MILSFIKCGYCPASVPTVSVVSKCPTNKTEWDEAASRKKCSHMSAKCGDKSPVYHCLLNQWRNETVEVCASTWYISGNYKCYYVKLHFYSRNICAYAPNITELVIMRYFQHTSI